MIPALYDLEKELRRLYAVEVEFKRLMYEIDKMSDEVEITGFAPISRLNRVLRYLRDGKYAKKQPTETAPSQS